MMSYCVFGPKDLHNRLTDMTLFFTVKLLTRPGKANEVDRPRTLNFYFPKKVEQNLLGGWRYHPPK